jgi:hypothetical protein
MTGNGNAITAYTSRLEEIRKACLHHHRTYYQMEQRWPDSPFWAERQIHLTPDAPNVAYLPNTGEPTGDDEYLSTESHIDSNSETAHHNGGKTRH